jgi:protein-S-isoprenylcysteine O-methyltransferase Ste14
MNAKRKRLVTRSTVRDLVLLVCCFSAVFFHSDIVWLICGFALLFVGCFCHIVSKAILVRNVVLSRNGIYSFVRHPYYLSNYLIDTGFCMLSGNPYLVVMYPFLFFWAYGPTVRREENFLSAVHNTSFMEHSSEIPQIFPDRASLKNIRTFFHGFSRERITWKECGRILRFTSVGCLLVLIQEINKDGWIAGLYDIVEPTVRDYDETILAFLVIVLFGTSLFLLSRSRQTPKKEPV